MPYNNLAEINELTLESHATCDNPCCILTLDCIVELMGNITLTDNSSGKTFATLPESMHPADDIYMIARYNNGTTWLHITSEGEMSVTSNAASSILYLNGFNFNVCGTYYNSEIGNNFDQGTSPMRWDGDDWFDDDGEDTGVVE